jgi:hypothetical protein
LWLTFFFYLDSTIFVFATSIARDIMAFKVKIEERRRDRVGYGYEILWMARRETLG